MPEISVIIPVYNAYEYLRKCLDSVVNQTFTDIEIICVNDCSTDGSLAILREYEKRDKRITVIDCRQNNRQAVARNIGMSVATGRYIAFVDDDDWLKLTRFENLYREAEIEKSDITLSGCICKYENGCEKYIVQLTKCKRLLSGIELAEEVISEKVSAGAPWHGIYRADFLKKTGVFFHSFRSEDYVFNMEVYTRAPIVCLLPECDYYFRALERSDSRGSIKPNSLWTIRGIELCVGYLNTNSYLRSKLKSYQDFLDKKTISEFCGIIINECSITSTKTLAEKQILLNEINNHPLLRQALKNRSAFNSLRPKQQLLIRELQAQNYIPIIIGLSLRELLKREYYRVKNCFYRIF